MVHPTILITGAAGKLGSHADLSNPQALAQAMRDVQRAVDPPTWRAENGLPAAVGSSQVEGLDDVLVGAGS